MIHEFNREPSEQILEIAEAAYDYIRSKCEGPFKTAPKKKKNQDLLRVVRPGGIEFFIPQKIRASEPNLVRTVRAYDMLRQAALRSAADEKLGREFLMGLNTGREMAESFNLSHLDTKERGRVRKVIDVLKKRGSDRRSQKAPANEVREFIEKKTSNKHMSVRISLAARKFGVSESTIRRRIDDAKKDKKN